jgi:hypothetical protein
MARKRTMNRKELRTDFDEAEAKPEDAEEAEEAEEEEEDAEEEEEAEGEAEEDAGDEEEAPPKPKKPKKKPAAPKRTRTPKVVAMKAVWVVFDNSSKQIETFPYSQHTQALALVETKNTDKKGAYYVQMVKIPLEEKKEKEEKETKKGK